MVDTAVQTSHLSVRKTGRRVELNMLSDPAALRPSRLALEEFGREAGMDQQRTDEMGLVLNEALANVMRHAYGGATDKPIHVTFEWQGDGPAGQIVINIRDWSKPIDPSKLEMAAKARAAAPPDPDEVRPGGLGLICMRRMMDQVTFTPQPDGMLLTMSKKISAPAR